MPGEVWTLQDGTQASAPVSEGGGGDPPSGEAEVWTRNDGGIAAQPTTDAANSAAAALASATGAATSETNAAASAATASTQATNAASSASAAAASATAAGTQATNAAASAAAAAGSASAASTSATNSANSATAAAGSATTASTQATNAANSASAAATSAASAASIIANAAVRYDTTQSLSAGEKTQARANIGSVIGTNTQAYSAQLDAVAALASTGLIARTAANTVAARTITGTSNRVSVTNGDGVSGNPTLDIAATYVGQTSITTLGTIATGTWQGTVIGATYGGFGANIAASSGVPLFASGTPTFTSTTGTGNFVRATSPTITGATLTSGVFNGTVGATTPATGAFTTVTASGAITGANLVLGTGSIQVPNGAQLAWNTPFTVGTPQISYDSGTGNFNFSKYGSVAALTIDPTNSYVQVAASGYLNFNTTGGSSGYGFRDNAGTLQIKNSGGAWSNIPTSGTTQWTTAGSDIYFNTGKVGLGTTTPAYALDIVNNQNAMTALQVTNTNNNVADNRAALIAVGGTVTTAVEAIPSNNTAAPGWANSSVFIGSGDVYLGSYGSGNLYLQNGVGTKRVTMTPAGLVGIGTTSPSSKLHVLGGDNAPASVVGSIIAGGTIDNERVAIGYSATGGYGWIQSAYVGVAYTPLILNSAGGGVGIGTGGGLTTGAVLQTGNGGVVMTQSNPATNTLNYAFSPGSTFNTKGLVSVTAEWTTAGIELGHALKVANNIRSSVSQMGSSFAIEAACYVEQDWYDTGAILAYVGSPNVAYKSSCSIWGLSRGKATTSNIMHLFRATSESDSGQHPSAAYLATASASDNFPTSGFLCLAADDIGFGCGPYGANSAGGLDPTYPFVFHSKSTGDRRWWVDNTGCVNVRGPNDTTGAIWVGRNNSNTITSVIRANGTFESAGGAASGGYTATSDRSLKENITDAAGCLDRFLSVRLVEFNRIGETERQLGVIHDEIVPLFPDATSVNEEGVGRVNYVQLFGPHLGKAFQEFVAETRGRFAALEARN